MKNIAAALAIILLSVPALAATGVVQSNGTAESIGAVNVGSSSYVTGTMLAAQMPALTGDVTNTAGALATNIAAIQGKTVSGTTGTTNVVFSASPNLTGSVGIGTATAASALDVYGAIDISGKNGISYPSVDTTTNATIAIGSGALNHVTALASAAYSDTAIGYQAIGSSGMTATAINDTAVGYESLFSLTSGAQDTAIGYRSGFSVSSGGANTSLGYNSLTAAGTTSSNTALGAFAMQFNFGNNNTAIGLSALINGGSSSNNVVLGYQAGTNASGSNNTLIGYQVGHTTLTSGADNILIGVGSSGAGGSDVVTATDNFKINIGNLLFWSDKSIAAPAVSACGTNSIDTQANNATGTVNITAGTPSSCTITFAGTTPYQTWNHCVVTPETANATFNYSYSTSAITLSGTALAGKFDYSCQGY